MLLILSCLFQPLFLINGCYLKFYRDLCLNITKFEWPAFLISTVSIGLLVYFLKNGYSLDLIKFCGTHAFRFQWKYILGINHLFILTKQTHLAYIMHATHTVQFVQVQIHIDKFVFRLSLAQLLVILLL